MEWSKECYSPDFTDHYQLEFDEDDDLENSSNNSREILNEQLEKYKEPCHVWCHDQCLEYSLPARLAHLIMTVPEEEDWNHDPAVKIAESLLPTPAEIPFECRELYEWRYPPFDLNLLQLAYVLDKHTAISYLIRHPFFRREENYRDANHQLINHPLHLAWLFCCEPQITLRPLADDLPEYLFRERARVDLNPARSKVCHRRSFEKRIVSLGHREDVGPYEGRLLPLDKNCDPHDAAALLQMICDKLAGNNVLSTNVETFWAITHSLRTRELPEKSFGDIADSSSRNVVVSSEWAEDFLLFPCQLVWAVPEADRGDECLKTLSDLFRLAVRREVPLHWAASSLPLALLYRLVRSSESWSYDPCHRRKYEIAVEYLRKISKERSEKSNYLKESAITSMNSRFQTGCGYRPPVPFQMLYGKLKERELGISLRRTIENYV